MSGNNDNLLIGLGLIIGAVFYTRRAAAASNAAAIAARGPLGTGSMPGSVGTGVAQTLGGLIGNMLSPKSGGGTSTGAPPSNSAFNDTPPQVADDVLQNSTGAADPMSTFDPTQGSMPWWEDLA